mmetsp:Transcript_24229/g.66824  ORF Transcript_24229/g.66824 Transcript_24229/m.66824 type:complete len:366 (+) Transcript_24229:2553-3650(+)|eukprot:scaffold208251_cov30-Tisochrysis_lutea.AAC.2
MIRCGCEDDAFDMLCVSGRVSLMVTTRTPSRRATCAHATGSSFSLRLWLRFSRLRLVSGRRASTRSSSSYSSSRRSLSAAVSRSPPLALLLGTSGDGWSKASRLIGCASTTTLCDWERHGSVRRVLLPEGSRVTSKSDDRLSEIQMACSSCGSGHAKAALPPGGATCREVVTTPLCQNAAMHRDWFTTSMGGGAGGASSNVTSMRASTSSTVTSIRNIDAHQPLSWRGTPCSQKTTKVPGVSIGKAEDHPSSSPGKKPDSPWPGAARTRKRGSSFGDGQCQGARSLIARGVRVRCSRCSRLRWASAATRSFLRARPLANDSLRASGSRPEDTSPSPTSCSALPGLRWILDLGLCCSHSRTSPARL